MAEEDKQKPKATLIKKKSEGAAGGTSESGDNVTTTDKKKVRVVLKRKPKARQTSKRKSALPEYAKQEPGAHPTTAAEDTPQAAASAEKPAPDVEADATPPVTDGGDSATTKDTPATPSVPTKADPKKPEEVAAGGGAIAAAVREAEKADASSADQRLTDKKDTSAQAEAPKKPGLAWSNAKPTGRGRIHSPEDNRPPLPSSIRRQARGRGEDSTDQSGYRGRTGQRSGAATRGTGAPPRTGQGRGPVRHGAGPHNSGQGPRPTGGRPGARPPHPGGPSQRGVQESGGERGNQKAPGKRFYKSRKGRGGYERDDRRREKEISFNRKKQQPMANPVPKEIDIMEVVTVSELARKMNLKANELIGKLIGMGMMVTINQQIDRETAEILAGEYRCKVNVVSLYDETLIETESDSADSLQVRSPIVTVMGHVDHGKTKLLDAIRSTNVVDGEHGGITQHIGAYQVKLEQGTVTFLDTPGHEAFTLMRARGAQITDIVILVVAANDGVMPQTIEAVSHAKEAGVPIIVAINKIDLPEANVDRVKQQLSDIEMVPEEWGGQTPMVEVSALKREGIEYLLETVLLQAELLELTANYDRRAEGKVIESRIDPGRGTIASVLIERGTLRIGDSFVAGIFAGKVRAMFDDHGNRIDEASPSMPVEILGFDGVPDSGDPFQVTEDEKSARQVGAKRQELKRVEEAKNVKKVTLDNLYDSIQDGAIQELKVVIKGDVHGSVEALQSALEKLSTPEIRLVAIHASAGAINEGDVMLASASNALVVGFHVRPTPRAQQLAEQEKVEIKKYSIIYDVVEDIRSAMEGMLAPDLHQQTIGAGEVRDIFKVPKIGIVAGCYVTEGKVLRKANVRVFRDDVQIHEGTISSLKRFKDDVREVDSGYECGIGISNLQDVQVGDTLEIYVVMEVAKKLSS